jgi:hypothetical protein
MGEAILTGSVQHWSHKTLLAFHDRITQLYPVRGAGLPCLVSCHTAGELKERVY